MTVDPGVYDVEPREAEHHAAEDARDERAVAQRVDTLLLRLEATALNRTHAAAHIPPSVAQFAIERLPELERIVRAAQEWRDAELHGRDGEAALYRLRDVLDRAAGLGIGQRGGVR